MKTSQIKKEAGKILSGNIKKSALFILFPVVLTGVFTVFPVLINAYITEPITGILLAGSATVIYVLLRRVIRLSSLAWFVFIKKKNRLVKSLYWMSPKRAMKFVGMRLSLFIRKAGWSFAFLFPGIFTILTFCILAYDSGFEFNLFLCGIIGGAVMLFTGLAFRFVILQRYFMAEYLLVSDPKIKVRDAVSQSKEIMNGRLKKTAFFKLSFVPWFVLCAGILPVFYVWPKYRQSCALLAKELNTIQKS